MHTRYMHNRAIGTKIACHLESANMSFLTLGNTLIKRIVSQHMKYAILHYNRLS